MKYLAMKVALVIWLVAGLVGFLPTSGEAVKDDSLALYLPFDEGAGEETKDQSGNSNVGTFIAGPEWTKDGKYGSAISFDGASSHILVTDEGFKELGEAGDSYTVEAWIKTSQSGGQTWGAPIIIEKRATQGPIFRAFCLYINGQNSLSAHFEDPVERVEAPGPQINDDKWHHICMVREGADVSVYVDGELATTGQIADNGKSAPDEPVSIGCRRKNDTSPIHYFKGIVDEVAVYSRALTEAEVKQDMEKGIVFAVCHSCKLATTWGQVRSR
jgi:hypothetical protein